MPASVLAAAMVMWWVGSFGSVDSSELAPTLVWTIPSFSLSATLAIAIPLWLVTMTSQNIPGVSVMEALGYDVPLRPALGFTGAATAAGAGRREPAARGRGDLRGGRLGIAGGGDRLGLLGAGGGVHVPRPGFAAQTPGWALEPSN